MKISAYFFLVLLLVCSSLSTAQTEKGKTLIAISSALGIGGNANGFAFNSTKTKSDNFESDPIKSSSLNLSPRIGYFLADNFVVGAEVFYGFGKQDDFFFGSDVIIDEVKTNTFGGGPFARYYFKTEKVVPFIEAGLIFGSSKTTFGGSNGEDKTNLFNYGGGAGVAIPLGSKVSFDALLGYSHFENKPSENNDANSRSIFNSLSLRLGFSIYLGKSKNLSKEG